MNSDKWQDLQQRALYFTNNYKPLFSYVQKIGESKILSDSTDRICRFCGKRYPEVKFKKKAHALSELIGNKEIVSRNECDTCNEHFGNFMEDELSKYLGLSRTLSQIDGKGGVPSYKSIDGTCRVDYTEKGLVIVEMKGKKFTEKINKNIVFHAVRQTYTPISVYKAFVKMALSVLPYEYMPYFFDTTAWLKEKSNIISKYDMRDYLYCIERFIPGPRPLQLRASGYIRKNDMLEVPYYQFVLEFANLIFQIAVPCRVKDSNLFGKKVSILPIPNDYDFIKNTYGDIKTEFKYLDNPNKVKNEPLDLCIGFEAFEEYECNGEKVQDVFKREGITIKTKKRK